MTIAHPHQHKLNLSPRSSTRSHPHHMHKFSTPASTTQTTTVTHSNTTTPDTTPQSTNTLDLTNTNATQTRSTPNYHKLTEFRKHDTLQNKHSQHLHSLTVNTKFTDTFLTPTTQHPPELPNSHTPTFPQTPTEIARNESTQHELSHRTTHTPRTELCEHFTPKETQQSARIAKRGGKRGQGG